MALLKKNIWVVFYLLCVIAVIALAITGLKLWYQTFAAYEEAQSRHVQVLREAAYATFAQQDVMLEIVGTDLVDASGIREYNEVIHRLDRLLKQNTNIAGFGLATVQGQLVVTSSNIERGEQELPSLLTDPRSRDSFLQAIEQPRMVIGDPYYMERLNTPVIPIRRAIRDDDGEPLAVMTAGIKLGQQGGVFSNKANLGEAHTISIIHDQRLSVLFQQSGWVDTSGFFDVQITPEYYQQIMARLTQVAGGQSPKNLDRVLTMTTNISGRHSLTSFLYEPNFGLWIVSEARLSSIHQQFWWQFSHYVLVFLLVGVFVFCVVRMVAEEARRQHQYLEKKARTDMLTGLPNRYGILHYLDHASDAPFSILFVDLKKFKKLNDTMGHMIGDQVLKKVSERFQKLIQADEIMARFGGDEFVFVTSATDKNVIQQRADALVQCIIAPFHLDSKRLELDANIGIASYPEDGADVSDVIRAADLAMYMGKSRGTEITRFQPRFLEAHLNQLALEGDIEAGIQRGEFFPVYQPQFDTDQRPIGVEALLRWRHPERGLVPPSEFIPIAERSGLMPRLGEAMLQQVFSDLKFIYRDLGQSLAVSVNISVKQLNEPDFVEQFKALVNTYSLDDVKICIEITESLFIEDPQEVRCALDRLKALGIMVSLDDFGTGYSSLSVLRQLPIDELKIDKSFIDPLDESDTSRQVVENVIRIGHALGTRVLAEGIECNTQFEQLCQMGCDYFQGYWYARPLSKTDLVTFLRQQYLSGE